MANSITQSRNETTNNEPAWLGLRFLSEGRLVQFAFFGDVSLTQFAKFRRYQLEACIGKTNAKWLVKVIEQQGLAGLVNTLQESKGTTTSVVLFAPEDATVPEPTRFARLLAEILPEGAHLVLTASQSLIAEYTNPEAEEEDLDEQLFIRPAN